MAVDSATSASAASTAASAADTASKKATLDYDSFLTLLIAQMKNQDPTEPMKASEQIAQLATFSQVEQTVQTNKNLESMLKSNAITQAGSIVGKHVTSSDGLSDGVAKEVQILDSGVTAVLEDGTKIPMVPGVTIKAPS